MHWLRLGNKLKIERCATALPSMFDSVNTEHACLWHHCVLYYACWTQVVWIQFRQEITVCFTTNKMQLRIHVCSVNVALENWLVTKHLAIKLADDSGWILLLSLCLEFEVFPFVEIRQPFTDFRKDTRIPFLKVPCLTVFSAISNQTY